MIKKIVILLIIVLFLNLGPVAAQETNSASETELQKKIEEYQQKLNQIRQEKNTLSSQIQYMDTQIYLTQLKIENTVKKITQTQTEIETLGTRIEGLDNSLNYISKLLIEKVVEGYKKRTITIFEFILNSDSANVFLTQLKYLKTTQFNNQKLLIQLQQTKQNFEEQKKLREEKVQQLDNLKDQLNIQNQELSNQKAAKQKLLTDTQNSENVYQQLLSQAQRQLASFKSFVQTSGANSIIGANGMGSGSDGSYYSQRDERWANKTIGYSSENVLDVGCLLTSVAMFAKKNGGGLTPFDIASDVGRFWGNTAWMRLPWAGVAGKSYTSVSNIDEELNNGNYVIVGVLINDCSYGGNHYVVLTKKDGNDYIMHDPIYGPDLKFSSHYSTICSAATFK